MGGGRHDEAVAFLLRVFDWTSTTWLLQQKKFLQAIEVSEAGFTRHNDAPQFLYHSTILVSRAASWHASWKRLAAPNQTLNSAG
eukprot:158152-Amphidinium_carterae.1